MTARGKHRAAMLAMVTLFTALLAPTPAAAKSVTASADAYVSASDPNTNYGDGRVLRVRNDVVLTYLQFQVPTTPSGEEIVGATLRLNAMNGSGCALGVEVFSAGNAPWGESTITWRDRPSTVGGALDSATWTSRGITSFDVSPAVTGSGRISFVVRHAVGCNASADATFSSRETTASKRPKLVVETAAAPAPACFDGVDNDGDGAIDFPADSGCAGSSDPDESAASPGGTKVLVAAGDIVCSPHLPEYHGADPSQCQHRLTDDLLAGADAVAPLGDLQYPEGSLEFFQQAYDPTWGQYSAQTYPVPGNHEYNLPGAQGYYAYWSSEGRPTGVTGEGYYGYDLGAWHVIALNSSQSCKQHGPVCAEGSPQNDWLEQDLAATTEACILAYWHHPRFNSGTGHGETIATGALWDDLYAAGADIVLNGHEHNYQRYAKQDPSGRANASGIRQFIVGSGGRSLTMLGAADPTLEFGNDSDFGVLRLTLADTSYSWTFVGIGGDVIDSGGPVACN